MSAFRDPMRMLEPIVLVRPVVISRYWSPNIAHVTSFQHSQFAETLFWKYAIVLEELGRQIGIYCFRFARCLTNP